MAHNATSRKVLFQASGLNQREIGETLGVSRSLISHVLAGRRLRGIHSPRIMDYLSHAFDVPLAELWPELAERPDGRYRSGRKAKRALEAAA